jgi:hypothetical protein
VLHEAAAAINTPLPGYGQVLPASPNGLHPTSFEGWFFTAYAGAMVVLLALPWAFRRGFKHRDWLPLLALIGGAVTSLGEPELDFVSHLRWATNLPGPAFKNFGLSVPLLIPPCYMLFMGLESYWIYKMIARGINKKQFMYMAAAVGLSDAIMEHPGLAMHTYQYYGNQPFKDGLFPWYYAFTNSVAICTIGVLIAFLWPVVRNKGYLQLAIIPLGIIGTCAGEFGTGFPVFLALNSGMTTWLQWVVGSITLVLAVLWIRVLAEIVGKETDVDWTFWGMFFARFMTPKQRHRYIEKKTRIAVDIPAGADVPEPRIPVGAAAGMEEREENLPRFPKPKISA